MEAFWFQHTFYLLESLSVRASWSFSESRYLTYGLLLCASESKLSNTSLYTKGCKSQTESRYCSGSEFVVQLEVQRSILSYILTALVYITRSDCVLEGHCALLQALNVSELFQFPCLLTSMMTLSEIQASVVTTIHTPSQSPCQRKTNRPGLCC